MPSLVLSDQVSPSALKKPRILASRELISLWVRLGFATEPNTMTCLRQFALALVAEVGHEAAFLSMRAAFDEPENDRVEQWPSASNLTWAFMTGTVAYHVHALIWERDVPRTAGVSSRWWVKQSLRSWQEQWARAHWRVLGCDEDTARVAVALGGRA